MKALLMLVVLMMVVSPAMAQLGTQNYSQNFESFAPGEYTPEQLGPAGSNGNGNWNVIANDPLTGSNVISPVAANDLYIKYNNVKFVDGTVASIDTRWTGIYFCWGVFSADRSVGQPFVGLAAGSALGNNIWVSDGGYGWDMSGNYGQMTTGHNYHLTATLDFTNQWVVYGINDLTDNTSTSFGHAFGLTANGEDAANGGFYVTNAGAYYDNFAVTTVPEPGSLLALCTGMVGILGFSIRRRK